MNHLETLAAEWLEFNDYIVRTNRKVSKRVKGGYNGELDVVAIHPKREHFIHVECSLDAWNWGKREERYRRKFALGRKHARKLFRGMELPKKLDQVVILGYASAAEKHRDLGGGRLLTIQELTAEIIVKVPPKIATEAVPESFPLIRTLQFAKMAGAIVKAPKKELRLIPWRREPDGTA